MNFIVTENGIVKPLNLLFNCEASSQIPLAAHAGNVHTLVLRSLPDITREQKAAYIAAIQSIDNGFHKLTYDITGVTHLVKLISVPKIKLLGGTWIGFSLAFLEYNPPQTEQKPKPEPAPTSHTTVNNITVSAKCNSCRRERINEAISTPKLDPNQIMDRIERILETIRI